MVLKGDSKDWFLSQNLHLLYYQALVLWWALRHLESSLWTKLNARLLELMPRFPGKPMWTFNIWLILDSESLETQYAFVEFFLLFKRNLGHPLSITYDIALACLLLKSLRHLCGRVNHIHNWTLLEPYWYRPSLLSTMLRACFAIPVYPVSFTCWKVLEMWNYPWGLGLPSNQHAGRISTVEVGFWLMTTSEWRMSVI